MSDRVCCQRRIAHRSVAVADIAPTIVPGFRLNQLRSGTNT